MYQYAILEGLTIRGSRADVKIGSICSYGEGGAGMVDEKITIQDASEVDPNLLRMLDRGLEDIEAGRTLPHDEAMAEVRRIREARRFARSNTGVVVNA
jgi:hypothetical protein